MTNLWAAWIGFLLGCLSGAIPGLFFFNENWIGGYSSWSRRMIRLAHIAFFGIGFINMAFCLTVRYLDIRNGITAPSYLLLVAAITMPVVCYLSAYRAIFRHLFFIPAAGLTVSIALVLWRISAL